MALPDSVTCLLLSMAKDADVNIWNNVACSGNGDKA